MKVLEPPGPGVVEEGGQAPDDDDGCDVTSNFVVWRDIFQCQLCSLCFHTCMWVGEAGCPCMFNTLAKSADSAPFIP